MPKQTQLCIPEGVINGFCYPFARRCLDMLDLMKFEGTLLMSDAKDEEEVGPVGEIFAKYLSDQIQQSVNCTDRDGVYGMMAVAQEFLDAFVVGQKDTR